MFEREREKDLWNRSDAKYRMREETGEKKAESFETGRERDGEDHTPDSLAYLENAYGAVEFAATKEGELTAAFRKKKGYREPELKRGQKKVNLDRAVRRRTGEQEVFLNSHEQEAGAAAYVLRTEKPFPLCMRTMGRDLERVGAEMADELMPLDHEVIPEEERADMKKKFEQAAKRSLERLDREKRTDSWEPFRKKRTKKEEGEDESGDGPEGEGGTGLGE